MRSAGRWLLCAWLGLLPFASVAVAQQTTVRIGYVDMQRLLDQAPQVLAARDRLQQEFAARDASLGKDETRLAALRDALDKERPTLSADQIAARERDIDALAGSVRRARERMQAELKTRSAQELDQSWQAISNAVVEYARRQHYDLVVPSPVIYASPAIDITDAVLADLRRQQPTAGTP